MRSQNRDGPQRIAETLKGEGPFAITSHVNPDGDSLGSTLATARWLESLGKRVSAVSVGGVPDPYGFLPGADTVLTSYPAGESESVVVVLDTPDPSRIGAPDGYLTGARLVVNLDHHPDNRSFGHFNLVDPGASSSALLVYDVMSAAGAEIDREIATALYAGLLTDTGGFRFGNTDSRSLRAAAELVRLGADPARLAARIYGEQPVGRLKLLGLVLSTVESALGGKVALLYLTDEMREAAGSSGEAIEGLASYGRLVSGVEVAALLREQGGSVRVSLRSDGRVDVNEAAKKLGGGGHRAAAGVMMDGPLVAARDRLLSTLTEFLG